MLILCLARVAVLGVAAITLASSSEQRASPEVVAQRRSSFAVVCACSVYFVLTLLFFMLFLNMVGALSAKFY